MRVVHLTLMLVPINMLCVCAKLLQSCPTPCDPMDYSCQAPLSMGFSRQEYESGLPCPPPRDLSYPGIEPRSLVSPALTGSSLPLVPPGKPQIDR